MCEQMVNLSSWAMFFSFPSLFFLLLLKWTIEEANDLWQCLPGARHPQVKPGGSGTLPPSVDTSLMHLHYRLQLQIIATVSCCVHVVLLVLGNLLVMGNYSLWVEITGDFLGGERRWFFVHFCCFNLFTDCFLCVLSCDKKPRKSRRTQTQTQRCLVWDQERSAITQWTAVMIRYWFELRYHSFIYWKGRGELTNQKHPDAFRMNTL